MDLIYICVLQVTLLGFYLNAPADGLNLGYDEITEMVDMGLQLVPLNHIKLDRIKNLSFGLTKEMEQILSWFNKRMMECN